MKKMCALFTALVLTLGLAACGGFDRGDGDDYDPTKTYLQIGNFDGGLGDAWLRTVADEYERLNPDIRIKINNKKDEYGDATLIENMDSYGNDLYFVNGITYQTYVNRGAIADITDVVTDSTEGASIADRMNPTLRDYYKTSDNKFYAVPFFDSIFGTVYDVDLFEEEGFYFNTDGNLICEDSSVTDLSAGPNGKAGDSDDGLPATYTQWKALLAAIKDHGMTPYIWTGQYNYYRYRFMTSIWADYEGKENFELNMSFSGQYTFDGDETPTAITSRNAYLLQKQQGKKYALDMAEYIIRNGNYYTDSFSTINSHTMAQTNYLRSVVASSMNRVAMILEGAWWENEARTVFRDMASKYDAKYAYGSRRFGFMPVPKSDDGKSAEGTTLISSTGNSVVFVSAGSTQKELAKDFLKFAHSEASLRTFTRMTGCIRPYDYTLTDAERSEMTHFTKNMWDLYHSADTDIVHVTLYQHPAFSEQKQYLGSNAESWWWKTTIGSTSYVDAMQQFSLRKASELNAENYFAGLQTTFSQSTWNQTMSRYFE